MFFNILKFILWTLCQATVNSKQATTLSDLIGRIWPLKTYCQTQYSLSVQHRGLKHHSFINPITYCVSCILNCVLCILHCVLCILHCVLCIMYSALCIMYSAVSLCISHQVLCIVYCISCIMYCVLFIKYCVLYIVYYVSCIVYFCAAGLLGCHCAVQLHRDQWTSCWGACHDGTSDAVLCARICWYPDENDRKELLRTTK